MRGETRTSALNSSAANTCTCRHLARTPSPLPRHPPFPPLRRPHPPFSTPRRTLRPIVPTVPSPALPLPPSSSHPLPANRPLTPALTFQHALPHASQPLRSPPIQNGSLIIPYTPHSPLKYLHPLCAMPEGRPDTPSSPSASQHVPLRTSL